MNTKVRDEKLYNYFIQKGGNITMAELGKEFNIGGFAASQAIDKHKSRKRAKNK